MIRALVSEEFAACAMIYAVILTIDVLAECSHVARDHLERQVFAHQRPFGIVCEISWSAANGYGA